MTLSTDRGDLGYQLGKAGWDEPASNHHPAWLLVKTGAPDLTVPSGPKRELVALYGEDQDIILIYFNKYGAERYRVRFTSLAPNTAILAAAAAMVDELGGYS